jgi:hypothetical protein
MKTTVIFLILADSNKYIMSRKSPREIDIICHSRNMGMRNYVAMMLFSFMSFVAIHRDGKVHLILRTAFTIR